MCKYYSFLIFFCLLGFFNPDSLSTSEWSSYFEKTRDRKSPSPILVEALDNLSKEGIKTGVAVDLGCGTGADTLFLLEQGWHVFAMDAEEKAIEITRLKTKNIQRDHLTTTVSSFTNFAFPSDVTLINASFSLPFCDPVEFPLVWEKITSHLAQGGRFSGQFFGDRDEWAKIPNRTHFTKEEVLDLLKEHFSIEVFYEQEKSSLTTEGTLKKWHVFHVVAKKNP